MRSSRMASPRSGRFAPRHLPFLILQVVAVTPRRPNAGLVRKSARYGKRKMTVRAPAGRRIQDPVANFPRVYPVHPQTMGAPSRARLALVLGCCAWQLQCDGKVRSQRYARYGRQRLYKSRDSICTNHETISDAKHSATTQILCKSELRIERA